MLNDANNAAQEMDAMTTQHANRWQQAISGLEIQKNKKVVAVNDGADVWLCSREAWDSIRADLTTEAPYDAEDSEEANEQVAYGRLCQEIDGAVVSTIGSDRGEDEECAALVRAAIAADFITEARFARLLK